jgi:hypothetical protein
MKANNLVGASEELLAHCADVQMRAGAYSVTEEDDSVVVTGWVRTIKDGRLADTQSRWV